ncbi:MAG: hypothetical protein ONB46_19735, partial [candidate division KSB1 bacterium]|nr:hypothetical protein [candidate division KSB1 bacterium]MDZ7368109.1 hypothetical protein [candidate division KSB1 bacterium]MDZ7405788.1 hypothetical protein [candidate division KSB1 bacterium]
MYFKEHSVGIVLFNFGIMKKAQLIWPLLFPFAFGIALGSTWAQQSVTTNQHPAAFVHVKEAHQKVEVKSIGQHDWSEIQKFARLFPGDSLKIPADATILLGDCSSPWKELTGPRLIVVKEQEKSNSKLGRFIERLYITFFKEPHRRRYSIKAVRSSDGLLITMPDTVFAYTMPDSLHWLKNARWWTKYRVSITADKRAVRDTVVTRNMLKFNRNSKQWEHPENCKIRILLHHSPLNLVVPELDLSRQGLHDRITEEAVAFFEKMLSWAITLELPQRVSQEMAARGPRFNRILIFESTSFQLPEELAMYFRGSGGGGSEAAVKICIPSVKSIFSLADEFCIFLHVHPIKEENHVVRNPTHAARPG